MRRAWLVPFVLAVAGCGGSADTPAPTPASDPSTLSADGISVDLPDGWTGRILIGAAGRPVLHAASYPVEANDTDDGEIAQEAMGINGIYLNVRDLGKGDAAHALPVRFDASDFVPSSFEGGRRREAVTVVSSGGERFQVTAVAGGDNPPAQRYLDQLNDALSSLSLTAYTPEPATASSGDPIDAFGLHANVPSGWEGGIARAQVHAGDEAVDLTITEFGAPDGPAFVTGRMPLTIGPAEFVQPQGGTGYETGRSFLEAGREFQLWVRSPDRRPAPEELARVNGFLAGFRAERGDFYPGQVEPAAFAAADGWETGSTGAAEIQPDGEQTMSWASTIPYRDSGFQFPPHETLDALPPDGIVILVMLEQHGQAHGKPATSPPFRLADFLDGGFEGVGPHTAAKHFNALLADYSADMWVFFGRAHPAPEQIEHAQAELDRLDLPRWPPWDGLTSAER